MQRDVSTCIHEAGHSLTALHFGVNTKKIIICPNSPDNWGYAEFDQRKKVSKLGDAVISLAGSCAEHLWKGLDPSLISTSDYESYLNDGFCSADLPIMKELTYKILKQNKKMIFRLAKYLRKSDVNSIKEFLEAIA